uniref:Defensin n=1 Tax=Rhipicephalus zambeziensis TaxID=60191 RepID=A0A224Y369_9ACAR
MLTSVPVYKYIEIPPQPYSPHWRANTQSSVTMVAANSALVLIFMLTLMMMNAPSSAYGWGAPNLQCQSIQKACRDASDCQGNCVCEELGNGDGTYSHQCVEPHTPVSGGPTFGRR